MSVNLNSVNFSYGEKQNRFELSDFDINVIQGLLKEINHNKKLVYFLPKTSFSPTLIILPTILNLINDISQNKKEITSTDEWIKSYFPIGTYVKVNSRSLAIIQDHIHNKNGKLEKIKLGLKDNDSYEMPISYIWRLQKYEGNARRLNRLEGIEKGDNNAFFKR
ncbi:hypothetical protein TEPIDINF_000216 [Tepidibacillus infernus]|uniref:hypothetical protein n=1 Tax=Tepidibacillus infernus TaxID=1806172 RepID=UPI003B6BC16B